MLGGRLPPVDVCPNAGVADEAHGMVCGARSRKTPLRCNLSQRDNFWVVVDIFRRNAGGGTYFRNIPTNTRFSRILVASQTRQERSSERNAVVPAAVLWCGG